MTGSVTPFPASLQEHVDGEQVERHPARMSTPETFADAERWNLVHAVRRRLQSLAYTGDGAVAAWTERAVGGTMGLRQEEGAS